MPRINVYKALEFLGISVSLHKNAYRFLFTLESPSSNYYNPHAASIIRRLLALLGRGEMRRGNSRVIERLIVLLMGQIEVLLVNTYGGQDNDSVLSMFDGFIFDDLSAFSQISKANFQEKIDSLLYGRTGRTIYSIESYCPGVSFSDRSASLVVYTSVMRYLNNTPDIERRRGKLAFLNRLADDEGESRVTRRISRMLSTYLRRHMDDVNTGGGDSFDRMFRRLVANYGFSSILVDKCIKARNKAVHEGVCRCGVEELALLFTVLFCSDAASRPLRGVTGSLVEQKAEAEVQRELRGRMFRKVVSVVVGVGVCSVFAYIIGMFVTGSYIGDSDIRRLRWDTSSSQFNARINELIATKDTSELLEVQRDLRWIDNAIYGTRENVSGQ